MSTELATQNQLQEVITQGSEILKNGELRVSKAVSVGEKIVAEIEAQGMDQAMDERCNKYLVNARGAKTDLENQRKPITAMFDEIRKSFTSLEAQLDPKKLDSVPAKIQVYRDAYVKKLRDEEAAKQKIAQAKIEKDNEIIDIKSSLETQLSGYVQNHILDQKQKLQASFNNITLDVFETKSKSLKGLHVQYGLEHFNKFSPVINTRRASQEEVTALQFEFMNSKDFSLIKEVVEGDLKKFVAELIEKLPSLKTSLDEMAKAGEEEQKRLADAKIQREKDAEAKIKSDAQAEKDKQAKEAEIAKVAEQTNAMMDNMVLTESIAPETRDGYKINLLNKTAIAEIFTFWFQREGMTLTLPELEKKSISQMKAYCEKVAHKSGDVIESVNLNYESVYKAVNRK